ncbi:MAG: MCE family protein [Bacteroidales bacterium]|nr:MCE family protein [Bacteroidales bacterium]
MKIRKETKIGLFIVIVIAMSFLLINWLRGRDLLNLEMDIVTRFDDVSGLAESAPVQFKGLKIGSVEDISYDKASDSFLVTCSVRRGYVIPADSRLVIYSTSIMGGKGIRIEQGTSAETVTDGTMLESYIESDLVETLTGSVSPLMVKIQNTLDSLSVTVASVNEMLCAENRDRVSTMLASLDKTLRNAEALSAVLKGRSAELDDFIGNLKVFSDKLLPLADKLDSTAGNVEVITGKLSEADLDSLVSSLGALVEKLQNPEGTLGSLVNEREVYDSLNRLLEDVDSFINMVKENPKKLKISVF